MTTMYGPFQLRASKAESNLYGRFTIAGSDGSDGLYVPVPDDPPIEFAVSGAQWSITFESSVDQVDWGDYDPTRSTGYTAQGGLTVKFWTDIHEPAGGFVFSTLMVVECVSTDPALSPPHSPIPVDFTLPEGNFG